MSRPTTAATAGNAPRGVNIPAQATSTRLGAIDSLRGFVIVFMLLDHVRETFFLHRQVPDPMVVAETPARSFLQPPAGAPVCAGVHLPHGSVGISLR
jgi:uncharacterized membrane protein